MVEVFVPTDDRQVMLSGQGCDPDVVFVESFEGSVNALLRAALEHREGGGSGQTVGHATEGRTDA